MYERNFADSYGTPATTLIHADIFHDEILLYHDKRLDISLSAFDYIEATEEKRAKLEEEHLQIESREYLVRLKHVENGRLNVETACQCRKLDISASSSRETFEI